MIVFGIKFWAWGSQLTNEVWRCLKCGYNGQFIQKKGMKFITLYWIIPTIPVSGISEIVQCPNCKTQYDAAPPAGSGGTGAGGNPPIANPWSNGSADKPNLN